MYARMHALSTNSTHNGYQAVMDPSKYQSPYSAWILGLKTPLQTASLQKRNVFKLITQNTRKSKSDQTKWTNTCKYDQFEIFVLDYRENCIKDIRENYNITIGIIIVFT